VPQEGADRAVGVAGPGHQDVAVVDRSGVGAVSAKRVWSVRPRLISAILMTGRPRPVEAEVGGGEGGAVVEAGALGERDAAPAAGQRCDRAGLEGVGEQRGLVGVGAGVALAAGAAVRRVMFQEPCPKEQADQAVELVVDGLGEGGAGVDAAEGAGDRRCWASGGRRTGVARRIARLVCGTPAAMVWRVT
jgi:hypothetical protein